MNLFFTSDEHYRHRNIISYSSRSFDDVMHMEREFIARHNAVIQPNDTVIHLGDFSLSERCIAEILAQLNGKHILSSGNHDKVHPRFGKARSEAATKRYLDYGFAEVHHEMRVDPFLVSHMPYFDKNAKDQRYPQYRPVDKGEWLLHGHIHQIYRTRGRMINVGVDVWDYAPVRLERLIEIMEAGIQC
jgi:calcineurin-like phosphoesterase family protein